MPEMRSNRFSLVRPVSIRVRALPEHISRDPRALELRQGGRVSLAGRAVACKIEREMGPERPGMGEHSICNLLWLYPTVSYQNSSNARNHSRQLRESVLHSRVMLRTVFSTVCPHYSAG